MFADDAVLYNTRENNLILQEDLHKLQTWAQTWQLLFNSSKYSVLSVGETGSKQQFFLNYTLLQNTNSHPYLGVKSKNNLKFDGHIDNIVSKASRLLGMLARVLKSADTKTRKIAYETLVRPVLEYECEVWDPRKKKHQKIREDTK